MNWQCKLILSTYQLLQDLAKTSHYVCILETRSSTRGLDAISLQMLTDGGMHDHKNGETREPAIQYSVQRGSILLGLQKPGIDPSVGSDPGSYFHIPLQSSS